MFIVFSRIIEALLVPPGFNFLVIGLGMWLWHRRPRLAKWSMGVGAFTLIVTSMPFVPYAINRAIETIPALTTTKLRQSPARAIVILGGGRYPDAPEYGARDTVSIYSLERVRYGAYVHRITGLPVLTSGGSVHGSRIPEAKLMAESLRDDFHISAQWIEGQSRTTWENARFSAEILHRAGIQHVLLVTHAQHMPRAVYAFKQAGLEVTAAPLGFHRRGDSPWIYLILPSADAVSETATLLHEVIGQVWYWLRS